MPWNFNSSVWLEPSIRIVRRSCAVACVLGIALAVSGAQDQRPALATSQQTGGGQSSAAAALGNIGGLTDEPIGPGQTVHVSVFNAPDFSVTTRVSESGDIAYPYVGVVHVDGLTSTQAADVITEKLKATNLMLDPHVLVTVDTFTTGITILGEVRSPGVYPPPGKGMLSDLIATAGGVTANTGRVIEISNLRKPDQKEEVPWDPTMHNTTSYDRPVRAGDRVLVRSCGIAYMGGHVSKPGAYSLCGSQQMTLSELVALSGGVTPLTSEKHVYLVRVQADGSRAAQEVNLAKVLRAKAGDPPIHEDDIVFVTPSTVKDVANRAANFVMGLTSSLLYTYH
ncbi:MAG TPA: polysaccharide biosynthesis/export family protein [Terracidiphilus sp.]|nr:polysaccharide biosynthesis/export family protein [Terracidiphilus sp.]